MSVRKDLMFFLLLIFTADLVYCLWPQIMGLKLGYESLVTVSEFFDLAETTKAEKPGGSFEYVDAPVTEESVPNGYPEFFATMQE